MAACSPVQDLKTLVICSSGVYGKEVSSLTSPQTISRSELIYSLSLTEE